MFESFLHALKSHHKIGVFSHIRPDGDCIGAQVGLSMWLQQQGFDVTAFNDDTVPDNLRWLTDFFPIHSPTEKRVEACDLYVLLDGNSPSRFGSFESWVKEYPKPVFCIDHHPDAEDLFDQAVIEVGASSTCELVARLIREAGEVREADGAEKAGGAGKAGEAGSGKSAGDVDSLYTPEMAKALYAGINTDTGSLQFNSVRPATVRIVADLLEAGSFTPDQVAEKLYSSRTMEEIQLLSQSLANIELRLDNQLAFTVVTQKMQEDTDGVDTGGLVHYPLSIAGVKVAILFKDLGSKGVKISLRSRSNNIDVNLWARKLQGGGHQRAAGAWHPGPMKKAIEETIQLGAAFFDGDSGKI